MILSMIRSFAALRQEDREMGASRVRPRCICAYRAADTHSCYYVVALRMRGPLRVAYVERRGARIIAADSLGFSFA